MTALAKLQAILRRLFRLDESDDLDFGVYRLINMKRAYLAGYLEERLPRQVAEALEDTGQKDREIKAARLAVARRAVIKALGEDALDKNGELVDAKFEKLPIGQEYLIARHDAPVTKTAAEMQEEICDYLATFFSRYDCGGGDIVPLRRYSHRGRYAMPHGGEETLLHWANRGQHYIKTAAYHPSLAVKLKGQRFVFRITDVRDIPQDNNKDSGRFLLPQIPSIAKDADGDIVIPFTFRALSKKEQAKYRGLAKGENGNGGNGANGGRTQAGVLAEALKQLTAAAGKNVALAPLLETSGDEAPPAFLRHARRFVRRNDADFFIHRDLRGFLSLQLDYYLMNEVQSSDAEQRMRFNNKAIVSGIVAARVIREVGLDIIDALAQWEDLQKALWEKKKFVLQTEYCATLGHIPDLEKTELLDAIADCEPQWAEWERLGLAGEAAPLFANGSKREKRIAWLRENPSLPVDTALFPPEFKDRLLAQFADLDEATDGVLIHGENWQALNLMQEMYRGRIDCIHIDPPYNTDTSGFLYKNGFKHSSWLAMMDSRISAALPLMSKDGVFQCHIDEHEYERLHLLFEQTPTLNAGTVVWDKRNPVAGKKGVATQHEYVIWRMMSETRFFIRKPHAQEIQNKAGALLAARDGKVTAELRKEFRDWLSQQDEFSVGEKSFRDIDDDGKVYQSVHMGAPEQRRDPKFHVPLVHPKTGKPCPVPHSGWSGTPEFMQNLLHEGKILFGEDETTQPRRKYYLHESMRQPVSTVVSHGGRGKSDLDGLGLEFPFSHAVALYKTLIEGAADASGFFLDHFGGSGTTAHAVMNLNREDSGRRKFILVEAGNHFNTTLLPRVKKLVYSPDWKDGKPTRPATAEERQHGPRLVKHQRIESYEDALANIRFKAEGLEFATKTPLYELQWDVGESPTWVLDPLMEKPFDYRLELMANSNGNGESARVERADLPETFAYLIGLRARTRRIVMDGDRRYLVQRGVAAGQETVILWRDTAGWKEKDYQRESEFIDKAKLTEGTDRVMLNDGAAFKQAESLAPYFARWMFATG